ncbi:hypothetical protein [Spirochaeta dissipatitropha]
MFENIIGHTEQSAHLKKLIQNDTLPQAVLISGGRYSGKLTIALEIARSLCCENGKADWNCSCSSCNQHRRLEHPHMLLMGNRNFTEELAACKNTVQAKTSIATRYLFGRAVRKLLCRFNPVLWEGEEKRLSAAMTSIESAVELVDYIFPTAEPDKDLSQVKLDRHIENLFKKTLAILEKTPKDLLNADSIRRMNFWTHISSRSGPKVIILEHVESLNDSQRNLLLKTLEEPPQGVYYILTTSKRTAILPTILSRLRVIQLQRRNAELESTVLQRVFRYDSNEIEGLNGFGSPLLRFFRQTLDPAVGEAAAAATRWAQHLLGYDGKSNGIPEEDLPGISSTSGADQRTAGLQLLRLMVEALHELFAAALDSRQVPDASLIVRFRAVLGDIDKAVYEIDELNMNAAQVFESLWFRGNAPA